jgi:hypothetical protein
MKYVLPIIAALASTFICGLILFPLVKIIFDSFFHLYLFSTPPPDAWKDDIVIWIAALLWILIATTTGGFVCSILSISKEDFAILIAIIISFIIGVVISKGEILNGRASEIAPVFLSFIAGFSLGGFLGVRYKRKKAQKAISQDTPSSLPDTPSQ